MGVISFLAFVGCTICCTVASALYIPTIAISDPNNPADVRYVENTYRQSGIGSVPYAFDMGTTEVTNAQYVAFLNSVAATDPYTLYDASVNDSTLSGIIRSGTSGHYTYSIKPAALNGSYKYENKPVQLVSFGSAMRFTNWLQNGQPQGTEGATTTDRGAYTMNGATTEPGFASITRNANARWWIPNEDEWYKSAYYDARTRTYNDFPTQTNVLPDNNLPIADSGNSANYLNAETQSPTTGDFDFPFTDVGAYARFASANGTFDQGGNSDEWIESPLVNGSHIFRGGSWIGGAYDLQALAWSVSLSSPGNNFTSGFRVASLQTPGDFNGDGFVNMADYIVWRNSNGSQSDYTNWRTHFGQTINGTGTLVGGTLAVPEPFQISSLLMMIPVVFLFHRGTTLRDCV